MERGGADVRVYAMVISGKADVPGANVLGAKCPTVPRNSLSTAADDIQTIFSQLPAESSATIQQPRETEREEVSSQNGPHTLSLPHTTCCIEYLNFFILCTHTSCSLLTRISVSVLLAKLVDLLQLSASLYMSFYSLCLYVCLSVCLSVSLLPLAIKRVHNHYGHSVLYPYTHDTCTLLLKAAVL